MANQSKTGLSTFTVGERILWCALVLLITGSFFAFDRANYLTLAASLIGVTSLVFNAKGNPFGQALMIVFSVLYGIISYSFSYLSVVICFAVFFVNDIYGFISWAKMKKRQRSASERCNR